MSPNEPRSPSTDCLIIPPNTYPYSQKPTRVGKGVADGITRLRNVGINDRHILDIVVDALAYADKTASKFGEQGRQRNPFQYLFSDMHMSKDLSEITSDEIQKTYNEVVLSWSKIAPLSLLEQYDAAIRRPVNDSGVENGLVAECVFSDSAPDRRYLLINPSPSFVTNVATNKILQTLNIAIAFSDKRYASICSHHKWPANIMVTSVAQLNLSKARDIICIFAAGERYETTANILSQFASTKCMESNTLIYLLVPSAFIDRRAFQDLLRKTINETYDLLQLALIDSKATHVTPRKRCIVVLQRKADAPASIPVCKVMRERKTLVVGKPLLVPYRLLLERRLTLDGMYQEGLASTRSSASKNEPKCSKFSPEIALWYSTERISSKDGMTKYRGAFRYYDFPTHAQRRTNKYNRGSPLTSKVLGTVTHTPEKVCECIDDLLLRPGTAEKPNLLADTIRSTLLREYGSSPLSVKTMWYLFLPELTSADDGRKKHPSYDDELCRQLFLGTDWVSNPICILIIGVSTRDDIDAAINAYASAAGISKTRILRLCEQLKILFSLYYRRHSTEKNPMQDLLEAVHARDNEKYTMMEKIGLRSLSCNKMRECIARLTTDSQCATLALLVKCKLYLPLSSGEAAALTIGDYITRTPGYGLAVLRVTKQMEQTGVSTISYENNSATSSESDCIRSFTRKWQNRLLPIPAPLEKELDKMVSDNIASLQAAGLAEDEIQQCPLFPSTSDLREPIKTRRINEYCAALQAELGLPSLCIYDPDSKANIDLCRYTRDLFQANWEYYARRLLKMGADTISYCKGRKPGTVTSTSYRHFGHPLLLKSLAIECAALIAHFELPAAITYAPQQVSIDARKAYTIPYAPQATASEIIITISAPQNSCLLVNLVCLHGCTIEFELTEE